MARSRVKVNAVWYIRSLGQNMKSVEQRLYEAYRDGVGVRLSAVEVDALVTDDAIATRITNAAAVEAGVEQPGADCIPQRPHMIWSQFGRSLRTEE